MVKFVFNFVITKRYNFFIQFLYMTRKFMFFNVPFFPSKLTLQNKFMASCSVIYQNWIPWSYPLIEAIATSLKLIVNKSSLTFGHRTLIQTEITCKKIPCYMHDSACRWFIVKKTKIFGSCAKHFLIVAGVRKCRILIGLCK